jgi:hypothetical protein
MLPVMSPSPGSWNSFNRCHFCIYMHVYTFFAPYSPSYLLSPPTPPTPQAGAESFSLILQKRKDKKKYMKFLLIWDKEKGTQHTFPLFLGKNHNNPIHCNMPVFIHKILQFCYHSLLLTKTEGKK